MRFDLCSPVGQYAGGLVHPVLASVSMDARSPQVLSGGGFSELAWPASSGSALTGGNLTVPTSPRA